MPHVDINELKQGRKAFTKDEWISVMLRSIGMEPDTLTEREKWLLLARMLPLVENNFNLCELGPRSTGKSHLYKRNFTEQYSCFWWSDNSSKSVLQYGKKDSWSCRLVGLCCF